MHKIILFVETNDTPYLKCEEIGNLFINRFAIDEDASFEILNIFEIGGPNFQAWTIFLYFQNAGR